MEHRKGYKAYLINGFKTMSRGVRFMEQDQVQLGLRLAIAGIALVMHLWVIAVMALILPLFRKWDYRLGVIDGFKLDKTGLDGDNLKLVDDLEKRMKGLPQYLQTQIVEGILNKELDTRLAKYGHLGSLTEEKVKELIGDGDKVLAVRSILLKQGEDITILKQKLENPIQDVRNMSIRQQVEKYFKDNKAAIDAVVKVKDGNAMEKRQALQNLPGFDIRVNTPMTPANTLGGSAYLPKPEIIPGFTDVVRKKPTFWNYLTKGRRNSALVVWGNKTNPLGAAGFIGPGVAKPGVSFQLTTESSVAKKVAASEKTTIELLDDIEGFATFMEQELQYKVDKLTSDKLMTSVEDNDDPIGIQSISVAFTAVGLQTANPNNYDAVRSAVAQLRSGDLDGYVTVFLNPIDKANMDMTKAVSQGQLYQPGPIDATLVEDNNIPLGYFQAAILDNFHVDIYKDYSVTWGLENDDLTKNLMTVIGERRIHTWFSENLTGSFIYDTFANVKAAIAAV